jgi:glycosyltransferase involved in cell wall biosynthesis
MISIIIPNYNKSEYLVNTINSVKSQTYQNWECIIVDDFSYDDSIAIIRNEIKYDKRFNLVVNKTNKGASYSRNIGIKKSSGDYILFLDSDDFLSKNCLKNRISFLKKKSNIDYAVYRMGTFYKAIGDSKLIWSDFSGDHLKRFLSHSLPWHTMMVLWRKKTLIDLNGFQESFARCQDVELHTRALISNFKYEICNSVKVDCFFRIDPYRIKNFTNFLQKDILGKTNYYNYFKNNLKGSKNLKNLKGTIFESYLIIYTYYKQDKITTTQLINLINLLENSFDVSKWSQFNKLWISIYKIIKKRKIHFKGLNFIFKLLLIK